MTQDLPDSRPPVCDYENSDYQSVFWDQGSRNYEDQVEAIALKRLLPTQGKILLEAGAGAGRNTPRYDGFERIVLLDYSISQLRLAQERLGISQRYTYVAADIYRLPFAPSVFDAATMIRTLHHMADPQLALQQMRNVLQTESIFILEFANKKNLKAISRYFTRRQSWNPFSPEPIEFVDLNFDFHPNTVRTWLEMSSFEVERQLTVSHFRLKALKKVIPNKLLVGMDSLAQLTGNWWQLTPSVFVRARAVGEASPFPGDIIFRCPECGHFPLQEEGSSLLCASCSKRWAIQDGIYNFREPL
jgi:ubiquinone/menaquinone biosynthesis C-methylase UbiE